jgi:membrane-associated phospholipid phosphatase
MVPRPRYIYSLVLGAALAACAEQAGTPPSAPARGVSGAVNSSASRDPSRSESSRSDTPPAALDWQQEARSLIASNSLSPLAAGRMLAALDVAEYRALLAADDEHGDDAHEDDGRSSFEARRGAVAGASQQVLSFFFPAAAAALQQIVDQESHSGPGNVHPQFTRGLATGQAVGAGIVTRTMNDGFTRPFTGTFPTGPGLWFPTGPAVGPTFGQVTPWLLASNSQFRPGPPPAFNSPDYLTALHEIRAISDTRTPEQIASANFWNFPGGTFTPMGYWNSVASDYIATFGLDERDATHVLALMHAAIMDAAIACWEAKYVYLFIRPPQADPGITVVFPLPNHPSYPSGHSCASSAAATILSHFFPQRTADVSDAVTQAGLSRMYAGIHYRFDIDAGQRLGAAVGQWAIGQDAVGALGGSDR